MSFASVWEWVLPIGVGLFVGILISTRKKHDFSQIIRLEAEEFRLNMRKGQLLDIRTQSDFETKRINGSRNFPKRSVAANLHRLRRDQAIFLYDANDSAILKSVSRKLLKKGFRPIYVLVGGIDKWPFNLKEL